MKYSALLLTCLLGFVACNETPSTKDKKVENCARAFAEAYFNYDFLAAKELVTPESEKWLRFAASSITEEDVAQLNSMEQGAQAEVQDITLVDDSTSIAVVEVKEFLQKDSIGKAATIVDNAQFELVVLKREKKYYVRMEGLPRSERQSRD